MYIDCCNRMSVMATAGYYGVSAYKNRKEMQPGFLAKSFINAASILQISQVSCQRVVVVKKLFIYYNRK